ncbi:hypothetical protein EC973_006359 [Apophysomyces ossiformis]|uniref:Uncharacterized protein n=1 Tax=Apophysomyces ossiformis TaxID=679940 RepID=A0A8H7BVV6_9FUNG|nr:hypothetical protein EC973_006359 [Apophysomyces ossiformis]
MANEAETQQTDLKALAKTLSDSYSALLQHATLSEESILGHLSQLAQYSNHLPLSWFTAHLLDALFQLKEQFSEKGLHAGLLSIYSLWAVWARRLSATSNGLEGVAEQQQLAKVLTSMEQVLTEENGQATVEIRKEAWIGLVALIGSQTNKAPDFGDGRLIDIMTTVIKNMEIALALGDTLDAGVAHCLAESTTLNAFEMEHLQSLLASHVQLAARRPEGARAVMTVLEHAVDVRSRQKPQTRAEADLETLLRLAQAMIEFETGDNQDISLMLARLAVIGGVVRTLQFTQGRKTKKVMRLREEAEAFYVKHLDMAATAVSEENQPKEQDTITLLSCQCLPNIRTDTMKEMNLEILLRILIPCLLTSDNIWKGDQFVRLLKVTPDTVDEINELAEKPLHKDIGRISRSIGKIIQVMLEVDPSNERVIHEMLDRLVAFSYDILIGWDRFLNDNKEPDMDAETKAVYKKMDTAIWPLFKTMIFAFTAILKAIAIDIPNGQGLLAVRHAAQDVVSIYGNFHFITERFGSGSGFKAYQETLTNSVAYLSHGENACQLNKLLSTVYQEYASLSSNAEEQRPVSTLSVAQQARLTFFTNLIEQVMQHTEDDVLEDHILPVIYPILSWKKVENKELFESAHAATLSVFSTQKPVAREVAGVYAKILIEGFPDPMTHHQLRFAYTTMIQSLCEMDDALSWLTVGQLIGRIDSLLEEKDIVLRSQYTVTLIDLLKPLSLGPFFGEMLEKIRNLVKQQETAAMKQATMKVLFETVSGPGISDMRRVEAVGWFLDLKRQISQAASI